MNKNNLIILSGNMCTGKSTLTLMLENSRGWRGLHEMESELPFVDDFYADMKRWSFHNQLHFVIHKLLQQHDAATLVGLVCQDQGADACFEVFSRKCRDDGLMSAREFELLATTYRLTSQFIRPPALCVYLHANTELLYQRLQSRGLSHESVVTREWLSDLNDRFSDWIEGLRHCPTLRIDTARTDIVSDAAARAAVMDEIVAASEGIGTAT